MSELTPDLSLPTSDPTGKTPKDAGALTLARVPLPTRYPLEDRGFHFVNEWGLEEWDLER